MQYTSHHITRDQLLENTGHQRHNIAEFLDRISLKVNIAEAEQISPFGQNRR